LIRVALILLLSAAQAQAGAWPRAEGETFLSFAVESDLESGITDGSGGYATVYLERGLARDLTLGLDVGGHKTDLAKAIGFLRWPMGVGGGADVWAMEFGLGLADGAFALRPGLSYGRGLSLGRTPAWLAVDSRALIFDDLDGVLETDLTLGLKPRPDHMLIMQVQTSAPTERDTRASIAPSYVFEISPGRHLEIGMTAGIVAASEVKIKLGLWHSF
jgi:hypothetical protein